MIQHKIFHDDHLDFSRPWPLSGFITNLSSQQLPLINSETKQPILIILDPFGDAHHTGRILNDTYERAQTLQFAEKLKKALLALAPESYIILTRTTGQVKEQLQSAILANSLSSTIFVSLSFYHITNAASSQLPFFLYYLIFEPMELNELNLIQNNSKKIKDYAYNHAHKSSTNINKIVTEEIYRILSNYKYSLPFVVKQPIGLPFKPLIGISRPAFGCEIGLRTDNQWHVLVEPLAHALKEIIYKLS